jgi:glycosyltransferase involved in cell wall biosynthesis
VQYQTAAYGMSSWIGPALWWVKRAGVRTAVTYHDLREPYLFPKAGRIRGWVNRMPARNADLVLTTTGPDARALAVHGLDARVVPIGSNIDGSLPADYSRSAWREMNGVAGGHLVGYFGFLNASKGVALLPALLQLLVDGGLDSRLVLIGSTTGASDPTNAATRAAFEADLRRRGLETRVVFTGPLPEEEVAAWLECADAVVLPYEDGASFRRGSLLGALQSGSAVVTTTPTEPDTSIVHERDALLAPAADPAALAAAVRRLAADSRLADGIRAGGKGLAAAYLWPSIARAHMVLYEEILAQ